MQKDFDWKAHNWEDCVGPGWRNLCLTLKQACVEHDVQIVQVKEKFGTLRWYVAGVPIMGWWHRKRWQWYWRLRNTSLSWKVLAWLPQPPTPWLELLIDACEHASGWLCEDCGKAGRPRRGGWVRTLCDACAERDGREDVTEGEDD